MANANPSGPGRVVVDPNRKPEINVEAGEFIVKLKDGRVVHRKIMNTGNVISSTMAPGEYKEAISETKFKQELAKATGQKAASKESDDE